MKHNVIKKAAASLTIISLTTSVAAHDEWSGARPDGHAPIGVMADHYHKKGEWMTSYRYMFMSMDGNRMGDDELSVAQVAPGTGVGFPIVPTKMYMGMHMFGMMYAPSDRVTLMGMLNYTSMEMDHVNATAGVVGGLPAGGTFRTKTDGIGDLTLGGLFKMYNHERHSLHFNLGLSLPTGSIDEQDVTPGMPGGLARRILPYPMQLGSGTVDVRPGMTYLGQTEDWSWGAQAMATVRIDENSAGYKLGDQIDLSGWIARRLSDWMSGSFRMRSLTWGNISGSDARLAPGGPLGFPVETADPNRRGGTRLDALLGANFYIRNGMLKGHRIAVEAGLPVYQYLNGPQLQTDWSIVAGWQYAF